MATKSGGLGLENRRALVTGGSRGVGRAISLHLAAAGAHVGISYRSREDEANSTLNEVRAAGRRGWVHPGDLADPATAAALAARAQDEFGGLDVLVVNHGVWEPEDVPLAEMSDEQWRRTLSANLDSVFYLLRAALPQVTDGGGVVLVTSSAAQRGEAFHGDYAASKGALQSLVKSLAVELAPRGVRVNAVAPGWVDTEMVAPAFEDGGLEAILDEIPLGRVATPEDVAGPVAFLASPLANHVTGEVLNVNGGAIRPG